MHLFLIFLSLLCFFFTDTATTEIYTLSLHDALPIFGCGGPGANVSAAESTELIDEFEVVFPAQFATPDTRRSEEHTSELQSLTNLVCRLLLEKKKKKKKRHNKNQHYTKTP